MARIIFSVIFLVALVILIVMNVGASTSVNIFGWKIDELSVTVVGLVSFVAGVIYSFIFYLMSYLERGRRDRLAKRKKKLKDQAAELKTREREMAPPRQAGTGGTPTGLFGRRRSTSEAVATPDDETPETSTGARKDKKGSGRSKSAST